MPNTKINYKYHTVYKIINLLNDKYYIGKHSTNNLNDNYFGTGRIIKDSIKKYGKDKFLKKILYIFDTHEQAYEKKNLLLNFIKINLCA